MKVRRQDRCLMRFTLLSKTGTYKWIGISHKFINSGKAGLDKSAINKRGGSPAVALGLVLYDKHLQDWANQTWLFAGSGFFGQRCSKHFPLEVGFLLCLAATLGCLNFSQKQIFIHQSMQCSTGQACKNEGENCGLYNQRGCVSFLIVFVTQWSGTTFGSVSVLTVYSVM